MSYLVLARKWRPRTFDEVVGQGTVTRTLKNALASGRIGHAFLLSGAFLCLMGSARSLTVTALALFMARFGGSITWVFSTVLLQLGTEDRYRGRILL